MDHFTYQNGRLSAEDVPIERIVEAVGTPVYVYSSSTIERHFRVFQEAAADLNPLICYAVKANGNVAVIRTLARLGAGADVVSGGELRLALAAGVAPDRIVFSGVGKSAEEMAAALRVGVLQINVESEPELEALVEVARSLGRTAPVAIRVNPDVEAFTHAKITTGRRENKFGIEWTAARAICSRVATMAGVELVGVACHIGSQLTSLGPFRDAFRRVRDLVAMLRADGHRVDSLDLGGGLGIPHGDEQDPIPSPAAYAEVMRETVADLGCRIIIEPGRLLVGNAGLLVARVLYVKEGATRTFIVLDAGMNDLIRPSLYDAYHAIVPVVQPQPGTEQVVVDVVGPVCESGDTFAYARPLPPVRAGELLAVRTAGAYGAAMASTYNARPLAAEVLVKGADFAVVSERMTPDALLARQRIPTWLENKSEAGVEAKSEDREAAVSATAAGGSGHGRAGEARGSG